MLSFRMRPRKLRRLVTTLGCLLLLTWLLNAALHRRSDGVDSVQSIAKRDHLPGLTEVVVTSSAGRTKARVSTVRVTHAPRRAIAEHHQQKKTKVPAQPSDPVKVLLVTYYRGGSSLLGQLFNQNPQAIYWFEPLIQPFKDFFRTHKHESNPAAHGYEFEGRKPSSTLRDFHGNVTRMIHHIMDCEMTNIPKNVYTSQSFTVNPHSKKIAATFVKCIHGKPANQKGLFGACVGRLRQACNLLEVRAVKTIRMSLQLASVLLDQDPAMRIIYLTRDPRGVIHSRKHLEGWGATNTRIHGTSKGLCSMMAEDWSWYQRAIETTSGHPPRIHHVRYEDLALRPQQTLQSIYSMLRLQLPERVKTWLSKNTKTPGKSIRSAMQLGTSRNASSVANKWRTMLKSDHLRLIKQNCARVIQQMGYPQ